MLRHARTGVPNRRTSRLVGVLVVTAAAALPLLPGAATAAPGGPATPGKHATGLLVSKVYAVPQSREGSGESPAVMVTATLRNRTGKQQPARMVRLFLRTDAGGRTFSLGTTTSKALGRGKAETLRFVGTPAAATLAGRYDVRVCAAPYGGGHCATSSGGPVVIAPPNVILDKAALDLGSVPDGTTSAPTPVTVINTGGSTTGPLALTATTTGRGANPFSVSRGTCGASLLPGASCTAEVTATPQAGAKGALTGTFTATAAHGTSASASLTATATAPADLAFDPTSHDFGLVGDGATVSTVFTLTNTGDDPATNVGLGSGLTGGPAWSYSYDCPATLAPGASCHVTITFMPVEPGQTSITVTAMADGGLEATATATGTGAVTS